MRKFCALARNHPNSLRPSTAYAVGARPAMKSQVKIIKKLITWHNYFVCFLSFQDDVDNIYKFTHNNS